MPTTTHEVDSKAGRRAFYLLPAEERAKAAALAVLNACGRRCSCGCGKPAGAFCVNRFRKPAED